MAKTKTAVAKTVEAAQSAVNHPPHYNALPATCSIGHAIECIDVVRHMNFNRGSAMKYIWRAGLKEKAFEIQDLEKAVWYLQDEIAELRRKAGQ